MIRRRGIGSFCHGDASTSTLQHQLHGKEQLGSGGADAASSSFLTVPASVVGSCVAESEMSGCAGGGGPSDQQPSVTLEQMILQLDLEEEVTRKARRAEEDAWCPRRMSCVDAGLSAAADHVLRSARDSLSQYPRFSLDGRDAMYRASFSSYYYDDVVGLGAAGRVNTAAGPVAAGGHATNRPTRASTVCCGAAHAGGGGYEMDLERTLRMPATVAGESVVWCKPGVVAKLMGLDAVPVPVRGGGLRRRKLVSGGDPLAPTTCAGGGGVRKQPRLVRRTAGQEEQLALQKERLFMALHGYDVVAAGAGACHAGAHRSAVGPNTGGTGRHGDGRQLGLRR